RNRPTDVIRASSPVVTEDPNLSAPDTMLRNLKIVNGLPWSPTRVCANRTGPGDVTTITRAISRKTGQISSKPTTTVTISRVRLIISPMCLSSGSSVDGPGCGPASAPRSRCFSAYRLEELLGEDPIIVMRHNVLMPLPAHGLALAGGESEQVQGCLRDGLRLLRWDGEAAFALCHHVVARFDGLDDWPARHHVVHELVRADSEAKQWGLLQPDEKRVHGTQQRGNGSLGDRRQE